MKKMIVIEIPIISPWENKIAPFYLHVENKERIFKSEVLNLLARLEKENREYCEQYNHAVYTDEFVRAADSIKACEDWPTLSKDIRGVNTHITINGETCSLCIRRQEIYSL